MGAKEIFDFVSQLTHFVSFIERFSDLGKLYSLVKFIYIWWFGCTLGPIFATSPVASKYDASFKSGQKWLKNNHLALLV